MERVTVGIDIGTSAVKAVAAYHSRVTAGLEADTSDARRWGRVARRVEPRAGHGAAAERRYLRFREGADR